MLEQPVNSIWWDIEPRIYPSAREISVNDRHSIQQYRTSVGATGAREEILISGIPSGARKRSPCVYTVWSRSYEKSPIGSNDKFPHGLLIGRRVFATLIHFFRKKIFDENFYIPYLVGRKDPNRSYWATVHRLLLSVVQCVGFDRDRRPYHHRCHRNNC